MRPQPGCLVDRWHASTAGESRTGACVCFQVGYPRQGPSGRLLPMRHGRWESVGAILSIVVAAGHAHTKPTAAAKRMRPTATCQALSQTRWSSCGMSPSLTAQVSYLKLQHWDFKSTCSLPCMDRMTRTGCPALEPASDHCSPQCCLRKAWPSGILEHHAQVLTAPAVHASQVAQTVISPGCMPHSTQVPTLTQHHAQHASFAWGMTATESPS